MRNIPEVRFVKILTSIFSLFFLFLNPLTFLLPLPLSLLLLPLTTSPYLRHDVPPSLLFNLRLLI